MSAKLHSKEPRSGFKLHSVGRSEAASRQQTGDERGKAASPSLARRVYHAYSVACVTWGTLCIIVLLARAA